MIISELVKEAAQYYCDNNISIGELSKKYDLPYETIRNYLSKNQLVKAKSRNCFKRTNRLLEERKVTLENSAKYFQENISVTIREVAKKFDLPVWIVNKYLKEQGLSPRKIRHRNFDERILSKEFFEKHKNNNNSLRYVAKDLKVSHHAARQYALEHGVIFDRPSSTGEAEIYDLLISLGANVTRHDRSLIAPYEVDLYLPDFKLGIEYNGRYWHSEKAGKSKTYHLDKLNLANGKGFDLIQIYDYEWERSPEIFSSLIKTRLRKNQVIAGRKCEIIKLSSSQCNQFMIDNHVQGECVHKISYGLTYQGELVSVVSFGKPRFNKNYDWELLRFANKLDISVMGGFAKLMKKFRQENNGSLITYSDKRLFSGQIYTSNGFKYLYDTRPSYVWIKKDQVLSRYQTQKMKLGKLLLSFDSNLSEKENMELAGYYRLWDCGQRVFEFDQ